VTDDKSKDTLLHEYPPDYMNEVDSFGDAPIHYDSEPGPLLEETTSLTGKLKLLCPTLFSSLTLWERDALENSGWLNSSTSLAKEIYEGGLGVNASARVSSPPLPDLLSPSQMIIDYPITKISTLPSIILPGTSQISLPQLFSSWELGMTPSPSPHELTDTVMEPGYREPEEDESSLNTVLDSLIPFIRDNNAAIKLPTYLGKALPDVVSLSEETTSKSQPARDGKDFSSSRGLGIELSPLKAQSSWKKLAQKTLQIVESVPSSTNSGPLKAMKALAREK